MLLSSPWRKPNAAALAVTVIVLALWVFLGTRPAFAHEFAVGILVSIDDERGDAGGFVDGFQLAVDESPDVRHAPGPGAGDHLGGLDVVTHIVELVDDPVEALQAALDLIEGESVSIVVVDSSSSTFEAIATSLDESGVFVLALSETDASELPSSPFMFVAGVADVVVEDGFEQAFLEAYGQPHTDAALRGYLAGKIIDRVVSETGGDVTNARALSEVLNEATGPSAGGADGTLSDETPSQNEAAPDATPRSEVLDETPFLVTRTLALGLVALVAVAGVGWRFFNGRSR